jgi:hypothetical protein
MLYNVTYINSLYTTENRQHIAAAAAAAAQQL